MLLPSLMAWELRTRTHNLIDSSLANRLVRNTRRGEMFFLLQLSGNLDPYIFAQLCAELDKSLESRKQPQSNASVPNGNFSRVEISNSLYPTLSNPSAAEKEAEAAASAAAAVEAAVEAAAERIELQEINEAKNKAYLKYCMDNADS